MNTGHGHVFPRDDGVKVRCGGPGICKECSAELTRKRSVQDLVLELKREIAVKQAEIDRLMLEYCPEEMTPEQMREWEKNQRPYDGRELKI